MVFQKSLWIVNKNMRTLGYYTYLIAAVVIWGVITLGLTRITALSSLTRIVISVVLGGGIIFLWFAVRPTETNRVNVQTAEDVENLIGAGKPVVLEFFSEY